MPEEKEKLSLNVMKNIKIEDCIFTIRGVQVMLDSDVAYYFGIDVKRLNQQMKRNKERFPEDFCFQLNSTEFKNIRLQNVTFNSPIKSRKYLPYVYTEQGIMALSGVIKNDTAVEMSIKIVRAFVSMRKFILENSDTLLELAKLQNRQINFEIETNNKFDEILNLIEKKDLPKRALFYDGKFYDAYEFICEIIRKAKSSIVLIDPYCDNHTFTFLKNRNDGVSIYIFLSSKSKLSQNEISIFESEYGAIAIGKLDTMHDRFLIIDRNECYSLGTSLNYMGQKTFCINKIEKQEIIDSVLNIVGL